MRPLVGWLPVIAHLLIVGSGPCVFGKTLCLACIQLDFCSALGVLWLDFTPT